MNKIELDQKAKRLAKNFKKLESELLNVLIEIEKKKMFYTFGFNSLFSYITDGLDLSPSQAYNFIKVTRKAIEVPQLQNIIEKGKLSISKAQKLTPVLNSTNQNKWFQLAQSKTHKQLEREVAIAQPQSAIKEVAKYKNSNLNFSEKISVKKNVPRIELKIGVSEKLMLNFRRAQDLECAKGRTNKNLEQTLETILEFYLNKTDPVRIAKRQKAKGKLEKTRIPVAKNAIQKTRTPVAENAIQKTRTPVAKKTIHKLQLRDQGRCTYVDSKDQRCSSRRYLQIHHIHPVAKGGSNDLVNLALVCTGHHRVIHAKE